MTALGESGPIVIVGGGLAGSLLATLLGRRGHDVELIESRPDLRRVDISAGRSINLALAARGIVALEEIGIMDRVREFMIPMVGRMVHAGEAGEEAVLQRYSIDPSDAIYSISRNELNGLLLDAATETGRVTMRFGLRCRSVDWERSVIVFTNRDREEVELPFGVVFGADGANSPVRASMLTVNGGEFEDDGLDHGYKELTLPPGADGSFRLNENALHIWPAGEFMLIALPNPSSDFTVTLFMPNSGGPDSFEEVTTPAAVEHLFEEHFPSFARIMPNLTEDFFDGPTGHLSTIRCRGWSFEDRAVLVGDSAHGIVPFHGQGMNAALESCLVLCRHLDESPDDIGGAFAAYEAQRKPDTDAIATMALSNYVEMRSGVVDPRYLLKRELAQELERRHPEHFSSRYDMVTFQTLRYSEAQSRSQLQEMILHELTEGVDSIDGVDFVRAESLVTVLSPLTQG